METKLMYLTTEETAEVLHCSTRYVCKLLNERKIPGIKMGRRYLVPAEALSEWVQKNTKLEV